MRCEFCRHNLVGQPEVVSIPGQGLAHYNCFISAQFRRRIFQGLDITSLSDQRLTELQELVATELNSRQREQVPDQGFELF